MAKAKETHSCGRRPKVLAVASFGGHLVQLMRVAAAIAPRCDVAYVSTSTDARPGDCIAPFHVVEDFSRTKPLEIFRSLFKFRAIIRSERPDAIISTGAAPGLSAIIVGRLMGVRTLWIDSVANAGTLSMCGRLASRIAHTTLTQWPQLADDKRIQYHGTVL